MSTLQGETYQLAFPTLEELENPPYISYGTTHHEAAAFHVTNTFGAKRAYIIASTTLSRETDEVEKLKRALGDRVAGVRTGISPHTPWNEVVEATRDALAQEADILITIGGGSIIDGAKCMLIFMANTILTVPDVLEFGKRLKFSQKNMLQRSAEIDCVCPKIPLICIPTTLSGGEYTQYGGGTDPETHFKLVMAHPFCGPRLIIYDATLTVTTPEWVWLSTGVRGIDHVVECFCRTHEPDESVDEAALEALKLIVPGLLMTKRDWGDEKARLQNFLGVGKSLFMLKKGVLGAGASHGIGHQLGPLNVGHGQTSCILLPSVMKFNARANGAKQEQLKKAMWSEPAVAEVLTARGLRAEQSDVGDALDAVFRELGMPRSLRDVGVGRDKFDALAVNSLKDFCCEVNPVPLTKEGVMEILETCAE